MNGARQCAKSPEGPHSLKENLQRVSITEVRYNFLASELREGQCDFPAIFALISRCKVTILNDVHDRVLSLPPSVPES
jgi:hypothetical protein